MERGYSVRARNYALILSTVFIVSSVTFIQQSQALTASHGQPYHGRLENGVPFPNQFPGYHLREEGRQFTTPEVVGALLDAIEAVRAQFPDTCDIYLGDFSATTGGAATHHRSHQNGRDVDIGMYAKGNRPLDSFAPMGEENLDAAKTWCLVENIIRSQRVQYIFLDRRVQKVLYDYASTRGYDQAYLDRVFGNVRGSLIQHVPNHVDHMHVRFFTPWSTLAAHIGEGEREKAMVIEMAQQSYLPKKVNYYVNASDRSLDSLAQSFGVTKRDLCRWNHLSPGSVPVPGSCLVFYKRSFESEPVRLAQSLQPGFIAQAPRIKMASLRAASTPEVLSDSSGKTEEPQAQRARQERSRTERALSVYTVKKGDTLYEIARRNNLDVSTLCRLNGIPKTASLRPGQKIKLSVASAAVSKRRSASAICFSSDPQKPNSPTAAYYTVEKNETLRKISRKTGISINILCQLNGLKRDAALKPGQRIKLTQADLPVKPSFGSSACPPLKSSPARTPAAKQKTKGKQTKSMAAPAAGSTAKAKPRKEEKAVQSASSKKGAVSAKSGKAASAAKPQAKGANGSASAGNAVKKPAAKAAAKEGIKSNSTADRKKAETKAAPKVSARKAGQTGKSSPTYAARK